MISKSIQNFLEKKSVNLYEGINAFLVHSKVSFSRRNHTKVNAYIQENFTAFSTFIDLSIKNGALNGKDVRLNYSYKQAKVSNEARREMRKAIMEEYKVQEREINCLRKQSEETLKSFIAKQGHKYIHISTEIRVPYLSLVLFFRQHPNLLGPALDYVRDNKFIVNPKDKQKLKLRYAAWRQQVTSPPVLIRLPGKRTFEEFGTLEEADAFIERMTQDSESIT